MPLYRFLLASIVSIALSDASTISKSSKSKKSIPTKKCNKLLLDKFSSLVVFGDSLSDQGNMIPLEEAYAIQSASNGEFAVQYIADSLGLDDLEMSNHLVAVANNDPEMITGTNYGMLYSSDGYTSIQILSFGRSSTHRLIILM